MIALAGKVKGNSVIFENDDINNYDGRQVIITVLDIPRKKRDVSLLENDSFVIPSDRANHVDEYMEEMRGDDRTEKRRNFFQSKKSVIPFGRIVEKINQELMEFRN